MYGSDYPQPFSSIVASPVTVLTKPGTPGAVQNVDVVPLFVEVYFDAVGYVPAGTVTGSIPAKVNCTSDLTSLGLL